jgi:hypothetical protein
MKDHEVGELWQKIQTSSARFSSAMDGYWCGQTEALIRKLVKERAWIKDGDNATALKDFGIDPETWKEK